jgi:hypothetical protein
VFWFRENRKSVILPSEEVTLMISTTYKAGYLGDRVQNDHDLHPIRTQFTMFGATGVAR